MATIQEKYDFAIDSLTKAYLKIEDLQTGAAKSNETICQSLGKVLGFPWYKSDLKTFPDATDADGVCVGDHVAESLAENAAERIKHLENQLAIDELNPNRRQHIVLLTDRINLLDERLDRVMNLLDTWDKDFLLTQWESENDEVVK
jgi:hypothetical protein